MTVLTMRPYTDAKESGVRFLYGRVNDKNARDNSVHLQYSDAAFYYRWKNDTLVLRCPYWRVKEDRRTDTGKFDFSTSWTEKEKNQYGYNTDDFYKKIKGAFVEVISPNLK